MDFEPFLFRLMLALSLSLLSFCLPCVSLPALLKKSINSSPILKKGWFFGLRILNGQVLGVSLAQDLCTQLDSTS